MKLAYEAFDKSGQAVIDVIEAADSTDAMESLRRRGLYVTRLTATADDTAADGKSRTTKRRWFAGRGRQLRQRTMFTRQLYVLLSTGTPLMQALSALERQMNDETWRDVVGRIRARVEEGGMLADAMRDHPRQFDSIYCSLVAAGEASGKLPVILDRLATLTRQQLQVRNSVVGAMMYPALLSVVSVCVVTLMLIFVLPRFTSLFTTLDVQLPPTTIALMWISDMLRSFWWVVLLALSVSGGLLGYWLTTPAGRRAWDTAAIRLPLIGRITRGFATARIARLLGMLLDSHLPLLETLSLVRQATANSHYAALVGRAEEAATHGEAISSAFHDRSLVDPSFYEAMRSGEQGGNLHGVLTDMAGFMDEENEIVIRSLTSILEPVILIILGAIVGIIAVSMFLPLFDLMAMAAEGPGG